MLSITDLGSHFLVLSYGRSGSVLLATNIGTGLNSDPMFARVNNEYSQNPQAHQSVVHSHLTLLQRQTAAYQRIFNLRRDPVETILSTILADLHNVYHLRSHDSNDLLSPIEYKNWRHITHICNDYLRWHRHYAGQLTDRDLVVVYEDMIAKLTYPDKLYRKTYPNKHNLITNYSDVVWFIDKHFKENLIKINGAFLEHRNSCDIYSYINV